MSARFVATASTLLVLIACGLFPMVAPAQSTRAECTSVLEAIDQSVGDETGKGLGDQSHKRTVELERQYLTFCQAHMRGDDYVSHLYTLANALNRDNQHQQAMEVADNCLQIGGYDLPCLYEKAVALLFLGRKSEAKPIIAMSLSLGATTQLDVSAKEKLRELHESLPRMIAHGSSSSPLNQIRAGVPLKKDRGTFVVPVQINAAITLNFTIDSGAVDVTLPADVFSTLRRTGSITDADISGERTYVLANGLKTKSVTFTIRSLRVGDHVVENVRGSVAPAQGVLLLGQSFLERFKSWSFDNSKHQLVLEPQ